MIERYPCFDEHFTGGFSLSVAKKTKQPSGPVVASSFLLLRTGRCILAQLSTCRGSTMVSKAEPTWTCCSSDMVYMIHTHTYTHHYVNDMFIIVASLVSCAPYFLPRQSHTSGFQISQPRRSQAPLRSATPRLADRIRSDAEARSVQRQPATVRRLVLHSAAVHHDHGEHNTWGNCSAAAWQSIHATKVWPS